MTSLTQRSILCPWQKAKKRKKNAYCIWTANESSSSASCNSFLSFKIFPRLFMAWTYLGFNLEMERKAKQTVTALLFSPNAQKPVKTEESFGEEPASWRARLQAYTCVPDCFPVVSDGCCLVALISQVFANVVVNLKAQVTIWLSAHRLLCQSWKSIGSSNWREKGKGFKTKQNQQKTTFQNQKALWGGGYRFMTMSQGVTSRHL